MTGSARDLVLAGPMGAGKTATGRIIAGYLGAAFDDLDRLISDREGASVPELFGRGEEAFRAAEQAALAAWLDESRGAPRVLALGGGALESPSARQALVGRSSVVHLDAPAEELLGRLSASQIAERPLLAAADDPLAELERLRAVRAAGYAEADLCLDTAGQKPEEIAVALLRALYEPDTGPWREPRRYVGDPDAGAGRVLESRGGVPFDNAARAVLVWDSRLPEVHRRSILPTALRRAGDDLLVVERAGGEGAKSVESLVGALRQLLESGVDRDVPLWVAGGGTLTDLGGLVGHTFKRGLACRLLPTTLLGQLDAALGGKNGINLDSAKNAVGTIRLPDEVHLDPLFLLTLRSEDLRCGLSEAIKSGAIGDPGLVDLIESRSGSLDDRSLPVLEEIAARAASVKLAIVAEDLYEAGRRRLLNFGHTLGHALEALAAQRSCTLHHGDAVAIGMVFATRLARRLGRLADAGLGERLEAALAACCLPLLPPPELELTRDALLAELRHDKKRRSGENIWVLPRRAGDLVAEAVADEDVASELDDWLGAGRGR